MCQLLHDEVSPSLVVFRLDDGSSIRREPCLSLVGGLDDAALVGAGDAGPYGRVDTMLNCDDSASHAMQASTMPSMSIL